jgi:hypothetical protein
LRFSCLGSRFGDFLSSGLSFLVVVSADFVVATEGEDDLCLETKAKDFVNQFLSVERMNFEPVGIGATLASPVFCAKMYLNSNHIFRSKNAAFISFTFVHIGKATVPIVTCFINAVRFAEMHRDTAGTLSNRVTVLMMNSMIKGTLNG